MVAIFKLRGVKSQRSVCDVGCPGESFAENFIIQNSDSKESSLTFFVARVKSGIFEKDKGEGVAVKIQL